MLDPIRFFNCVNDSHPIICKSCDFISRSVHPLCNNTEFILVPHLKQQRCRVHFGPTFTEG